MPKVVGIKFKNTQKVYYFDAGAHSFVLGGGVVVETARGLEFGTVALMPTEMDNDKIVQPLKPIVRIATKEDLDRVERHEKKHDETVRICEELISKSGLNMKFLDAEYAFDDSKLVIHFSSDSRVDFRELVKKMASAFHTRIELRQVGARDECKLLGGLGPCGRTCCCKGHLKDYTRVSIKMAKNQNLSLNPTKISGLCGRLMCCLEYENSHYLETNKRMPKMGATVTTTDKREGIVVGLNQLKETVKIKVPEKDVFVFADVPLSDVEFKGKGSNLEAVESEDIVDEELKNLE